MPQGLHVTSKTQATVGLAWNASTDDVGVVGYHLYRDGVRVASIPGLSYTFSGLSCGTVYAFGLEAYDAAGKVSYRPEAVETTSTEPCGQPSPPPSPPPPPGDGTLVVSTTGSDANPCTQSAPCQTFNRAYQVAACGDVVVVRGGSYPAQTISYSAGKETCAAGSYVIFTNATGETVNVNGEIRTGALMSTPGAEHLGFQGQTLGQFTSHVVRIIHAEDFMLDRMDSRSFYINGSQNVTIRRSDFGPCNADLDSSAVCQNNKIEGGSTGFGEPDAILVEGNTFHDYRVQPGSAKHWECLLSFTGRNVTIRGNKFVNCEFFDMLVEECCGFSVTGWTIENNWFDAPLNGQGGRRSTALHFGSSSPPDTFTVRFNSFNGSAGVSSNYALGGTNRWYGNLFGVLSCIHGAVLSFNVYDDATTCGGLGEVVLNSPFPYAGAQDYHLVGFVPLILGRLPSDCTSTDIDGDPRNAPCDAGSDELGSG